ncbi:MAG: 50S ribosomal protein L17 [Endomicrobium sp.]|jgi:large subunit ribosomal protein L17|nr:50S ribosomal protein L17 [Endomicrobium sp.]
MIKTYNGSKLNITSSHKRSLMRNLANSFFLHETIITTLTRAKELSRYSEKLITKAKEKNLKTIRNINTKVNKNSCKKLFDILGPRYKKRNGGYTKILKFKKRHGDNAELVVLKLL